uniref:Uncharacterized protein n=1 Tax=Triticum urartu TaxID=4572 RepID=A0A8R7V2C9_TRIUA
MRRKGRWIQPKTEIPFIGISTVEFGELEPEFIHPIRQVSARKFIGDQASHDIHVVEEQCLAPYYLYEILHLKGNNAKRPHQFIEFIDE